MITRYIECIGCSQVQRVFYVEHKWGNGEFLDPETDAVEFVPVALCEICLGPDEDGYTGIYTNSKYWLDHGPPPRRDLRELEVEHEVPEKVRAKVIPFKTMQEIESEKGKSTSKKSTSGRKVSQS